jgi:hypothetical protein
MHPEDSMQDAIARGARSVELLAGGVFAARPFSEAALVSMDLVQHALGVEALGALKAARRGLDGRLRDVTGIAGVFLADPALVRAYGEGARLPLE